MPIGASLHIGLNAVDPKQYSGWDGQLTACEFDANDMQALAKAEGFTKVTKRLTKKATRNRVLADIKAAASKLKRDDIFFLTYSGHGGQEPNTGNNLEPEGYAKNGNTSWTPRLRGNVVVVRWRTGRRRALRRAQAIRQGRTDLRAIGQLPQ